MFWKRNEFKPDRTDGGALKKLYLTPAQRNNLLKWVLVGVALVVLSLLQDVVLCQVSISGATFDLVACGILLFCMFFEPESTVVFALVSSTLYYFAGTSPGAFSIVLLTGLGTFLCIFRQSYLQRKFSAVLLCAGVGIFVYELMVFAIGWFLGSTTAARFGVFALSGILSAAVMPALYPVFLSIRNLGGETWKE